MAYVRTCEGVLAVGKVAEQEPDPEGEGDATPGHRPGTGLPSREPSPGPGRIDHPLPNLSEQDAERITRLLADERAELEAQSARGTAGQPDRTSQFPSSVPFRFRPARRPAVASVPDQPLPATPGPAAEPSWRALGTMVAELLDGNGGARSGVSLAFRPSKVLAADIEYDGALLPDGE